MQPLYNWRKWLMLCIGRNFHQLSFMMFLCMSSWANLWRAVASFQQFRVPAESWSSSLGCVPTGESPPPPLSQWSSTHWERRGSSDVRHTRRGRLYRSKNMMPPQTPGQHTVVGGTGLGSPRGAEGARRSTGTKHARRQLFCPSLHIATSLLSMTDPNTRPMHGRDLPRDLCTL